MNLKLHSQSFENITTLQGLSSNRTFSVAESSDGYIWISTKYGIDRYDGKNIKFYSLEYNNYTISEERIYINKIIIDKNGNLWAFNQLGVIYRYSEIHDRFEIITDMSVSLNRSNINLNYLHIDNKLGILAATDLGLFLLEPSKNDTFSYSRITYDIAYSIKEFNDDFILSDINGIHTIERNNDVLILANNNPNDLYIKDISAQSIHIEPEDSIMWIGTSNSGLYILNYSSEYQSISKIKDSKFAPIRSIQEFDKMHVIVGTDGDGAYIINKNTLQIDKHLTYEEDDLMSLSGNGIYDIFVDKNHNAWIATYTGGVSIYDPFKPKFNSISHIKNANNSLINNRVNAILEDSNGGMWYATDNGISLYDKNNDQWKHFMNKSSGSDTGNNVFLTLCEDNYGYIWAGGYNIGAISIEPKTHKITQYKNDKKNINSLGSDNIYSIVKDSSGNLWFSGSLTCYNIENQRFIRYPIHNINAIIENNKHELFLGTTIGLLRFEKRTGESEPLTIPELKDIKDLRIRCFYKKNDTIWIGTDGYGLICYDRKQANTQIYNIESGLTSNYIYGIVPDDDNRVWISTEKGINCIYTHKDIDIYGVQDGLSNPEFMFGSFCRKRDGSILFGTSKGVIWFQPENYITRKESKNGTLRFTDFILYNSSILNNKNKILQKSLDKTNTIKLNHNQNFFSIEFTEIDFLTSQHISYSYKLENIDNKWSTPSKYQRASYTNIPPGEYQFRVKTIAAGKERNYRDITIQIKEPWWNSLWIKPIYLILFALIMWAIYRIVKHRIEEKNNKEKIDFFISTAHDIRTPVTLIKSPLIDIENDKELSEKSRMYLKIAINNTNKLMRFVNQLLDLQKSDLKQMKLTLSKQNLIEFIENHVESYKVLALHKNISFTYTFPDNDYYRYIDTDKIDKVLDNLLSNAFKYTNPNGYVNLNISTNNNNWSIEVKDSGIGVPKSSVNKLFKHFYRADNAINSKENGSGIGLLLTKNLVKLHKGNITFRDNNPNGSIFTVTFQNLMPGINAVDKINDKQFITQSKSYSNDNGSESVIKMMLVEDNDELRNYLAQSFSDKYKIYQYADGKQALSSIKRIKPDIIISDIMMPNMNGNELCEKIKNNIETSHIPVILLSALDDRSDILNGFEIGADDYISKPFDIVILKSKINSILINRKKSRERYISDSVGNKLIDYNNKIDNEFLDNTIKYIEKNIDNEQMTINEICQEMAMSRTLFYNKLTTLTNQSPNEFIRVIRLKHAADLLKSGEFNIGKVATKVGIPDTKYFSKLFKLFYGVSPKDYTKKLPKA